MKKLLSVDQLIEHMKAKGITFNKMTEEDAKEFLKSNNYYMKLASYRANYNKYPSGRKEGQYINLDFAYLRELSTIDMHLRYLIIRMCLDIEHSLKVTFISKIENNPLDDGYELIRRFLGATSPSGKLQNEYILRKIHGHRSSDYCKDLIDKYYPYFPVWVFVELISFGDLTYLIDFYNHLYSDCIVNNKFMNIVRDLRNAAAHSSCLINKLFEPLPTGKQIDCSISNYVAKIPSINATIRAKYLNYRVIYNFVVLIYVYEKVVPDGDCKKKRHAELKDLVNNRMCAHKDYFQKETRILGAYRFIKLFVDNLN